MREKPDHPVFGSEDVPSPERLRDVSRKRSLAKAVSWRVIGTLDTLLLSFVILTFLAPLFGMEAASHADNARTATYIAVTEVLTKLVIYYLHEEFWARLGWGITIMDGKRHEMARRSGLKTATWRITASLDTMVLALIFTGNLGTAVSIGGFEVMTKLLLYYLHERAWSRIQWGLAA